MRYELEELYYRIRMKFYNSRTRGIAWIPLLLIMLTFFIGGFVVYFFYYKVGLEVVKESVSSACYDIFLRGRENRDKTTFFDILSRYIYGPPPPPEPKPLPVLPPKVEPTTYYGYVKKAVKYTGKTAVDILTDEDTVALLSFVSFMVVVVILI